VEIMLLEFTVENYRSIKEPVTLSAVAQKAPKRKSSAKTKRGVKSDAEICPGFPVEGWDMELLPVMAIFGANASGKSNVLQALDELLELVNDESDHNSVNFTGRSYQTFMLDKDSSVEPIKFSLCISQPFTGTIYKYYLEISKRVVIREKLEYATSKTRRFRLLFDRKLDGGQQSYTWKNGEMFSGPHIQLEASVSQKELFITLLRRLSISITEPLSNFLESFIDGSTNTAIDTEVRVSAKVIRDLSTSIPEIKTQVVEILKKFDVGIQDLEFQVNQGSDEWKIYAIHQSTSGEEVAWSFAEESLGTQRLFSFAWGMVMVLHVGGTMIFDELGTNLHPAITAYIIQLFQNPKTNPHGAQLIFTSHDNTLQRNQLLRRDQIWFTEKRPDQSTDLYSLADFKVRNDLAIDKAYLDGRFGAVPFLPDTVEELLGVD
jgi:uncharacterized protein